jgi:hypothetical protein
MTRTVKQVRADLATWKAARPQFERDAEQAQADWEIANERLARGAGSKSERDRMAVAVAGARSAVEDAAQRIADLRTELEDAERREGVQSADAARQKISAEAAEVARERREAAVQMAQAWDAYLAADLGHEDRLEELRRRFDAEYVEGCEEVEWPRAWPQWESPLPSVMEQVRSANVTREQQRRVVEKSNRRRAENAERLRAMLEQQAREADAEHERREALNARLAAGEGWPDEP